MTDVPLREIQPKVVPAQYLLTAPFAAAFLSFFPAILSTGIVGVLSGMGGGPPEGVGIVVFCLSFVVVMGLLYVKHFWEPRETLYRVFSDRVEYNEGLWNRQYRTVIFDQVIDVELTEGVLQQTEGVGTVTLVTQQLVSMGEGRLSNRRISMTNIPDARGVYDLIRSLAIKRAGG